MAQSKTFIGVIWASFQRFGTMIISFISNLVLARLLTPKDFGTVGMLLFFISISQVFIDSGFGAALIQKKDTDNRDYSTIFFLNIAISIVLYGILFITSPWIANFYDTPILTLMLRIEGLVLFGNALSVIQTALLRKQMNFKSLAIANLIGNSIGTILAITAAKYGCGVWSLIIRVLCVSFLTSGALWILSRWRPIRYFNIQSAKELFGFGGFMLLSTLLNTAASNLQTLIIGKLFHQQKLGLYTQAMTLRNVAADSLQSIIGQVLFPDYSSLTDDSAIARKLNNGFYLIAYFTTALLVLLLIIGKPLIVFMYTEKWVSAAPYFQILCVGGIFYAIQDVNYYVIAAKGKSNLLAYINLIKIPIYIACLFLLGKYCGIYGILWCIVGYCIISYLILAWIATKLLRTSLIPQYLSLGKSIASCIIPGLIIIIGRQFIYEEDGIVSLIINIVVYVGVLLAISRIFKAYPLNYMKSVIRKNGKF